MAKVLVKYNYKMPVFLLSAVINGDTSGLNGIDRRTLYRVEAEAYDLMKEKRGKSYTWDMPDIEQEPYFTRSPDFINLGCDVVDMQLVIFK